MKSTGWFAVIGAVLSLVFAFISLYFAFTFHFATKLLGSSEFTVDQVLASLTLVVALVGLIVAITAIGVGFIAVFGYGELRQITTRRASEVLRKTVYSLRKRGEISAVEARTILESLEDEELVENEPPSAVPASKGEEMEKREAANDEGVKKYPSKKKR